MENNLWKYYKNKTTNDGEFRIFKKSFVFVSKPGIDELGIDKLEIL